MGLGGISIMFRSPSRIQRSKGFKVKHALQICLLLAVCFWLIYQVKHSHDKKKEFEENDAKLSLNTQGGIERMKFGRKDLQPREEATKIDKHMEEENEEEEEAGGIEEEGSKHDEEQEEEESKADEREDEGRGGGDDEIDENDQDRAEGEPDHEEEFIDEDKEKDEEGDEKESREKENEEKDDLSENEKEIDGQDHDGGSRNDHEAREEHYKADDASSAVAHDAHSIDHGADIMEDFDENTLEQENKADKDEEVSVDLNNSKRGVELDENGASLNVTDSQEKFTVINPPISENSSILNFPVTTESNVQPDVRNSNSSEVSNKDSSESGTKPSDVDTKNGTETISEPTQAQNATGEGINTEEGADLQNVVLKQTTESSNATDDNESGSEPENTGSTTGESSNSISFDANSEPEKHPESLILKENTDAAQNEKPDNGNGSGESDGSSESSINGSGESIQHDPIDASDSSIPQEEKEPPPMQETRTDVHKQEGAAAE